MAKVYRIILNFTGRCNMACPFCYVPFDGSEVGDKKVIEVVEAIIALNPEAVTIGGGDPFMFRSIVDLLAMLHDGKRFIQVDTNAKSLKQAHIYSLLKYVNLVGLPLDGGRRESHELMRAAPGHFKIVMEWLHKLSQLSIGIKINTVVSRLNLADVINIGYLLSNYNIAVWSLYQFWPMQDGLKHNDRFNVDDAAYSNVAARIKTSFPRIEIESATITERSRAYLFVNHNGTVYTVDPQNHRYYLDIGSIFEADVLKKWQQIVDDPKYQLSRLRSRRFYGL